MGIGYLVGGGVLISEIVGGCAKKCRQFARRNSKTIASFTTSHNPNTSTRPSFESETRVLPISYQERMSRSIFNRFRRKSSAVVQTDSVEGLTKHTRNDSVASYNDYCLSPSDDLNEEDFIDDENNVKSASNSSRTFSVSEREEHKVQINRAPTPYIEVTCDAGAEKFGEIVRN